MQHLKERTWRVSAPGVGGILQTIGGLLVGHVIQLSGFQVMDLHQLSTTFDMLNTWCKDVFRQARDAMSGGFKASATGWHWSS